MTDFKKLTHFLFSSRLSGF